MWFTLGFAPILPVFSRFRRLDRTVKIERFYMEFERSGEFSKSGVSRPNLET